MEAGGAHNRLAEQARLVAAAARRLTESLRRRALRGEPLTPEEKEVVRYAEVSAEQVGAARRLGAS